MQKIIPFLWFDDKAEEAANFYTSIFKDSKIERVTHYGDTGPGPKGTVMSVVFQLEGQEFYALNGDPPYTFNPAISFFVNCEDQRKWIISGKSSPRAEKIRARAGLKINTASPGK
jgi:predicted 3-demethylubiquinone-9 3-methyltransferase (glyoxalase superfamily)